MRATTLKFLGTAILASSATAAVGAEKAAKPKAEQAPAGDAAATGDADAASKTEKKVRYKKSKQLDFSSQSVEGKLARPEASLVTASEGVNDNGLLRLREDFLDKFATFAGEEIQQ